MESRAPESLRRTVIISNAIHLWLRLPYAQLAGSRPMQPADADLALPQQMTVEVGDRRRDDDGAFDHFLIGRVGVAEGDADA